MKRIALISLLALAASACGGDPTGTDGGTGPSTDFDCTGAEAVTTAQIQTEIIEPRCKVCHNTDTAAQPGNMNTTALTQALVGKASSYAVTTGSTLKWIDPSHPENSTMYLKVLKSGAKGPKGEATGVQMPQGSSPLTAAEKTRVKNWICTGAVQQ
jgi:hypothetical protein